MYLHCFGISTLELLASAKQENTVTSCHAYAYFFSAISSLTRAMINHYSLSETLRLGRRITQSSTESEGSPNGPQILITCTSSLCRQIFTGVLILVSYIPFFYLSYSIESSMRIFNMTKLKEIMLQYVLKSDSDLTHYPQPLRSSYHSILQAIVEAINQGLSSQSIQGSIDGSS